MSSPIEPPIPPSKQATPPSKRWPYFLAGAALAALSAALFAWAAMQFSFSTSPLDLLPEDMPEVDGLRVFQENFGTENDLIIMVEGEDPEACARAANRLADRLAAATTRKQIPREPWQSTLDFIGLKSLAGEPTYGDPEPVVRRVDARPPWEPLDKNGALIGELIGYAWANQDPEKVAALAERLSPENLGAALDGAIETIQFGMESEAMWVQYDPLQLASFLLKGQLQPGSSGDGPRFANDAGTFRAIFVEAPGDLFAYRETAAWLEAIQPEIDAWQGDAAQSEGCRATLAGRAPYIVEISSDLEGDLKGSTTMTVAIIVGLFWLFYRRVTPLLWLVLCLALTFGATMAVGAFLFDELSAMSGGFAAILVGLAVDYAFVIYQEYATEDEESHKLLRRRLFQTIGWAALTTACVFAGMNLSHMPGVAQMGTLVSLGILLGASVMLIVFPFLLKSVRPAENSSALRFGRPRLAPKPAGWVAAALLALSAAGLAIHGIPPVSTDPGALRPKDSVALENYMRAIQELSPPGKRFHIAIQGEDAETVLRRLRHANAALELAVAENKNILGYALPTPLWPNADAWDQNRAPLAAIAARAAEIRAAATEVFEPESLALDEAVFDYWRRFGEGTGAPPEPSNEVSTWILHKVICVHPEQGRFAALGSVEVADVGDPEGGGAHESAAAAEQREQIYEEVRQTLAEDGVHLVGWEHLRPAILHLLREERVRLIFPMVGALFVMLLLVFRSTRGVLLSIGTLAFSGIVLLACMAALGWEWNLINFAAIPLLLGAGLDYSIHIQLAIRRLHGDCAAAQRGIGRALLLCGFSTSAGFGSLGFSNSAALSSMGQVCALGILITMATAVFLLPSWWRWANPKLVRFNGDGSGEEA